MISSPQKLQILTQFVNQAQLGLLIEIIKQADEFCAQLIFTKKVTQWDAKFICQLLEHIHIRDMPSLFIMIHTSASRAFIHTGFDPQILLGQTGFFSRLLESFGEGIILQNFFIIWRLGCLDCLSFSHSCILSNPKFLAYEFLPI